MSARSLLGLIAAAGLAAGAAGAGASNDEAAARAVVQAAGVQGGLIVHLGCGDGRLTAALGMDGRFLVHGITPDEAAAGAARRAIQAKGIYGQVSVECRALSPLPYAGGLANLVVVDDVPAALAAGLRLEEVFRVVCPGGVAMLGGADRQGDLAERLYRAGMKKSEALQRPAGWVRVVKPRPEQMDQWTHNRYDESGNIVSRDALIGAPTCYQWTAGPPWQAASMSVVSAGGRNFHYMGKPTQAAKDNLAVLARDAFSGVLLWERTWAGRTTTDEMLIYPLPDEQPEWAGRKPRYNTSLSAVRPGGNLMPMVAVGDRLYTVFEGTAAALDAATGQTLLKYAVAGDPKEIVHHDGALYVVTDGRLYAFDAATGKLRWEKPHTVKDVLIGKDALYCQDIGGAVQRLMALDPATGARRWRTESVPWTEDVKVTPPRNYLHLQFCKGGVLAVTGGKGLYVFSADDGKCLWTQPYGIRIDKFRYAVYSASFYWDGLVWVFNWTPTRDLPTKGWNGFDPRTGKVKQVIGADAISSCSRVVATERMLVGGAHGYFFETRRGFRIHSIRGACNLGVLLANGMMYGLEVGCCCDQTYLLGYQGLSMEPLDLTRVDEPRLVKGPAYGNVPPAAKIDADEWTHFRHDRRRSGATSAAVPDRCELLWQRQLSRPAGGALGLDWSYNAIWSGTISPPTAGGGKVFVALPDAQQVVALDAASGQEAWRFTAAGRIVAPPTLHENLCLVGSQDGWVYCLRVTDGELVWRFRAHPVERRIVACGQVESAWPVHGGVLVHGGTAFAAAGRSSRAEGGIHLIAVEPATGRLIHDGRAKQANGLIDALAFDDAGYLSFPNCPGWEMDWKARAENPTLPIPEERLTNRLTMNWQTPGRKLTRSNLLDGAWFRFRTAQNSISGWACGGGAMGHLLAFSREYVCGYIMDRHGEVKHKWRPDHVLYAKKAATMKQYGKTGFGKPFDAVAAGEQGWSTTVKRPNAMHAMVLAGEKLIVGGARDMYDRKEGMVWTYSLADGKKLQEIDLKACPVYEGLAAANSRLYVATQDGGLLCFGKK